MTTAAGAHNAAEGACAPCLQPLHVLHRKTGVLPGGSPAVTENPSVVVAQPGAINKIGVYEANQSQSESPLRRLSDHQDNMARRRSKGATEWWVRL